MKQKVLKRFKKPIIHSGQEWTFDLIEQVYDILEQLAREKYHLNFYPNQLEVITSEQMLDAYSAVGMPVFYSHWSFGEEFVKYLEHYKKGYMGLAYEIVINCLRYDTLITTDNGIKQIKDITLSDRVWNGQELISIIDIKHSKSITHTITLENGITLHTTPNHKHYVVDETGAKKIKITSELTENDWLVQPQSYPEITEDVDLSSFYFVPPVTGFKEKYNYQPYCKIPNKMNEQLAELLGIITGDGCISHTIRNAFYIAVGHDVEQYQQHIEKLIQDVFDITPHVYERPSSKFPEKTNKNIYVSSSEIKEFIDFCGLHKTTTAKNKIIPWSILNSSNSCKAAFLRGLFDTDGCVKTINGEPTSIEMSCINYELAQQVSIVLTNLGISNSIRKNKKQNIYHIQIVSDGIKKYVKIISSSNQQKYVKLQKLLQKKDNYKGDKSSISKLPLAISSNTRNQYLKHTKDDFVANNRLIKVQKIEISNIQTDVVDLSISSNNHLFCANGILTHNSNPCISYLMEENVMAMQALVIAHAAFGHNHFFKNNYLFKQWTDADAIIDYLVFAKKYIRDCEEKYGFEEVEATLDAAHSLRNYGVDKYKRPPRLSSAEEERLATEREKIIRQQLDVLWSTIPTHKEEGNVVISSADKFPKEPQENLLYFIEKNAPRLEEWQREIIRIVRKIMQYFYPQGQTKMMNEGFASYMHYNLIHDLYDLNILDDGAMMELLASHTGVISQPEYHDQRYYGINPYALGFAMMNDIVRVANEPTEEDRAWFASQDWIGSGRGHEIVLWAVENFKDESFILQFLSPKVIRDFKLFDVHDDERDPELEIAAIHNEQGYRHIRSTLSHQYNNGYYIPDIQVVNVDRWGSRTLTLRHFMVNKRPLEPAAAAETLEFIRWLWQYPVILESVDENNETRAIWENKDETILDIFLDDSN
jgi:stage V sporulation protein R